MDGAGDKQTVRNRPPNYIRLCGCHAHRFGWACEPLKSDFLMPTQSRGHGTQTQQIRLVSPHAFGYTLRDSNSHRHHSLLAGFQLTFWRSNRMWLRHGFAVVALVSISFQATAGA